MKILVADDDPQLVRALRITLATQGYDVLAAPDGAEAVAMAARAHPDIVLLDLGMPRLDGVQVIQALRGWTSVPIIVVSGRAGWADKVEALDAGADDYVTKPFQIDELLARLRALTRRAPGAKGDPVVSFGDVTIDLSAKSVTRGGTRVHLTPTEWRMLEFLARNPGALVTRQTLLQEMWATESVTDSGYLRLYMSQLRKKLEADPAHPNHLLTESGMGYRLVLDGAERPSE
ncbi:MAG TPA: response regulator transcription factor [Ilumatobacteraceae bacterium]|jgi:two-component system KDP operon response regulator KdpE